MLTGADEFLTHQTPEPILHVGTGDRNFYDRFFFNGFTEDGEFMFGGALGLYPNRQVMDAAFSLAHAGKQTTVRASRRAPLDRLETAVGPIRVDVVEPMRALRLTVDQNEYGPAADLTFRARTPAVEEPRFTHRIGQRLFMDYTRYTQFGLWEGWIDIDGVRHNLTGRRVLATRDRSWGIRPVGEPDPGVPTRPGQFFWLWSPLQFDDVCTHFAVNEDAEGRPWHVSGCLVPVLEGHDENPADNALVERMARVNHHVTWRKGTRRAESAELILTPHAGESMRIALEPIATFQMLGLGYLHPEWGHGVWKGEQAVGGETWTLADMDPMVPFHIHVQQLCRARMGERQGYGLLEQLVLGPHAPSGFREILDPAE